MPDKINKLLDSRDLDNILLAIQLAYKLPLEDFEKLFKWHPTGYSQYIAYKFRRNNNKYLMGKGAILLYNDEEYPNIIDLTPEDYEGENR